MSKTRDLEKKLDELTSKVVRLRDKYCIICGSPYNLECGHWKSRYWRDTRWDLDNCHTQCHDCNQKHEIDSRPYDEWMQKHYPFGKYIRLIQKTLGVQKLGYSKMLLIYEELKEKEREYGGY